VKKVVLAVAGIVVLALVVLIGVASQQPESFHIERSVSINAAPDKIYPVLADFNRFKEWSPWQKLDPNMQISVVGEPGVVGTKYAWISKTDAGEGSMAFTAVEPNQKLVVDLEFLKPFPSKAITTWALEPNAAGTKVIWAMDGKNDSLMAKIFALLMDMDAMLGKDFDAGLGKLKQICETT
jgi:uncharacterized protein YndB with AHSA1/START domain